MKEVFNNLLMSFIPLFVAIDVLGGIPLFMALTAGLNREERRRLTRDATFAAAAVALIFLVSGKLVFSFLGITEDDFRIGGGIVLLVLSVYELLFASDKQRDAGTSVGVVPIGIPLIMGPAALTSIIIVVDSYGYWLSMISLALNLLIVWIVLSRADIVLRFMGVSGSRAFAKIANLFMAAIAVMMVRVGVQHILRR